MHFEIKRDTLLKSLNFAHNIIERKNTLPILSNVLLEAKDGKLKIVATDLDLVFNDEISDIKITKDGSTTTSATVLHDLLRKLPSNLNIIFAKDKMLIILKLLKLIFLKISNSSLSISFKNKNCVAIKNIKGKVS